MSCTDRRTHTLNCMPQRHSSEQMTHSNDVLEQFIQREQSQFSRLLRESCNVFHIYVVNICCSGLKYVSCVLTVSLLLCHLCCYGNFSEGLWCCWGCLEMFVEKQNFERLDFSWHDSHSKWQEYSLRTRTTLTSVNVCEEMSGGRSIEIIYFAIEMTHIAHTSLFDHPGGTCSESV